MTKVSKKIVNCSVVTEKSAGPPVLHEAFPRPELLHGITYKIKTPLSEHALYITINDIVLGSNKYPFEIFINSKSMEHFQWIVALTRIVSAVFRKGGESVFLIDELRSVFDPKGGYFKKGKYMPSLVAEIGEVIEHHLTQLGLYKKDNSLSQAAVEMVKEKLNPAELEKKLGTLCNKCGEYTAILLDGCLVCTSCGNSKCG